MIWAQPVEDRADVAAALLQLLQLAAAGAQLDDLGLVAEVAADEVGLGQRGGCRSCPTDPGQLLLVALLETLQGGDLLAIGQGDSERGEWHGRQIRRQAGGRRRGPCASPRRSADQAAAMASPCRIFRIYAQLAVDAPVIADFLTAKGDKVPGTVSLLVKRDPLKLLARWQEEMHELCGVLDGSHEDSYLMEATQTWYWGSLFSVVQGATWEDLAFAEAARPGPVVRHRHRRRAARRGRPAGRPGRGREAGQAGAALAGGRRHATAGRPRRPSNGRWSR